MNLSRFYKKMFNKTKDSREQNNTNKDSINNLENVLNKQKTIGKEIYIKLYNAALKNTICNMMQDGQKAEGYKLKVQEIENNGGTYSILVGIANKSSFTEGLPNESGYPVLQIDVDVRKNQITAFEAPYGPSRTFGIEDHKKVMEIYAPFVNKYTLFPR